jgi:hypothetical protein
MRNARNGSDATVSWMTNDVAQRCNDVLEVLSTSNVSAVQLGNAAMLLRSAADDLVSLVEVVEGSGAVAAATETPAFGLSFGTSPGHDPESGG